MKIYSITNMSIIGVHILVIVHSISLGNVNISYNNFVNVIYYFQICLLSYFPQIVARILCVKLDFNAYFFSLFSIFCGIVIPVLLNLFLNKIHSPSLAFSRTLIGLNK
jgi:hypothetical protein